MPAKILLADDSITIQKMVHQAFENGPYELFLVGNGEAAIRKLREFHPDLVLADIYMPGKNGYEVCEYIRNQPDLASIPVILLVGAFEPFDEAEAVRVRADGHLTKPFAPKMLSETVEKCLSPGSAVQASVEPPPLQEVAPPQPSTRWHAEHDKTVPMMPVVEGPEVAPWFQAVPMEEPDLPAMSRQFESAPDGTPPAPADVKPETSLEFSHVVESMIDLPAKDQLRLAEESHSQASMEPMEAPIGAPMAIESGDSADETVEAHPAEFTLRTPEEGFAEMPTLPGDHAVHEAVGREAVTEEFEDFRRSLAVHAEPDAAPLLEHQAEAALPDDSSIRPEKPREALEELMDSLPPTPEHGGDRPMTQGQAEAIRASGILPAPELSEATIDAIARRVIEKMSSQVVEEVAWEVVPEVAEMMLRRIIAEKK